MSKAFPKISADHDAWTGVEAEIDDRPILIRFRPELAHFEHKSMYQQHLVIRWDFGDDGDSGMPNDAQSDDMGFWEDALVPALEKQNAAILAYVTTTKGCREWHLFFAEMKKLKKAIDSAVAGMPPMPLKMESSEDPDWAEFHYIVESVG